MKAARINPVLWILAILCLSIALWSARYLIPGAPAGAEPVLANPLTKYGFLTVHAGLGLIALSIGAFQFMRGLRMARPRLHRRMGQVYVVCCLVAGSAGLFLAFGSTAGPIATAGFGSLAVIWLYCTFRAWRSAVARDFAAHERWMTRSFALTFGAVTLRLYLGPSMAMGADFFTAYRIISFAAWVPNLLIAEMIIAARRRRLAA